MKNDVYINGNGKTLTIKDIGDNALISTGNKNFDIQNIKLYLETNFSGPVAYTKNFNLGDNCVVEIVQRNLNGYALFKDGDFSDAVKNKYDILGKVDPDDSEEKLKPAIYDSSTKTYKV